MRFSETNVTGAYLVDLEPIADERGYFARAFCRREFAARGAVADLAQVNLAFTRRRATLRGLHYQAAPFEEAKFVRCIRGAAYVVALDLRPDSLTYLGWEGAELTAENRRALYVPPGCAQGYQTLIDDAELLYQMSQFYTPAASRGVRYDDPAFRIEWPLDVAVISQADLGWAPYTPVAGASTQLAASGSNGHEGKIS
ncbi:MAG TPA: dTDP-4-dehydrorhamnose 3,5-epimerase family protein [Pirellulales bacterium]|jgi:dTDP-4-dehydrorhamnose 3,5-epimerase|nr:dTDP-4-dehydrorhamnose 3,5-epimerase family protein [Pirellulales bacterium]